MHLILKYFGPLVVSEFMEVKVTLKVNCVRLTVPFSLSILNIVGNLARLCIDFLICMLSHAKICF